MIELREGGFHRYGGFGRITADVVGDGGQRHTDDLQILIKDLASERGVGSMGRFGRGFPAIVSRDFQLAAGEGNPAHYFAGAEGMAAEGKYRSMTGWMASAQIW